MLFPLSLHAEVDGVARREGFLLLWAGISRAVADVAEEPFADVPEGSAGFGEITFAKARGIIEGERGFFRPEEYLLLQDALLWLFRTRNVADLEVLRPEDIHLLIRRYPLVAPEANLSHTVARKELLHLAQQIDTLLATEEHRVSLYAEDFHGDHTAFGEIFDMHAFTAAHRTLPQNTLLRVTNAETGKSVIVRINDRGPYIPGRDLDLSLAAFTAIAPRSQGVIRATFERLGDSAIVGPCGLPQRYQQRITRDVRFHRGVPHALPLGGTLVLSANRPFVVRRARYPDGTVERIEDWVLAKEKFTFRPSMVGTYIFRVGTPNGRSREMRMEVVRCSGFPLPLGEGYPPERTRSASPTSRYWRVRAGGEGLPVASSTLTMCSMMPSASSRTFRLFLAAPHPRSLRLPADRQGSLPPLPRGEGGSLVPSPEGCGQGEGLGFLLR